MYLTLEMVERVRSENAALLAEIRAKLDSLILRTPSGEVRNELTQAAILLAMAKEK